MLPHLSLRFPGFTVFREDRGGRGGGLVLSVNAQVPCKQLSLLKYAGGVMEVLAISVAMNNGWASILLCYNPCKNVTKEEFQHYFGQLPKPRFIMGDFNARHQYWDPSIGRAATNQTGRSLFNTLLDDVTLSLLTPAGLRTRIDPHTATPSTLDLYIGDGIFQGIDIPSTTGKLYRK